MKIPVFAAVCFLVSLGVHAYAAAPTITDFSPANGPVGSTVVIDGANFVPPLSIAFGGNVQAAGSFTSTKITVTVPSGAQTGPITVTASGGSVSTVTSFTVGSAAVPVVTLAATVPTASVSTGEVGEFTLALSVVQANDVTVDYSLGGSAVNGTDYAMLKGTVKIKAGNTTKVIKVVPEGDLGGASKKTVKLTLEAGTGYTVGTTTFEKVKITP